MAIGENIRLLRISKGMSQRELAKKANTSTTMICYIENGQKAMPKITGIKIARALECSYKDLMTKEYQVSTK